MKKNKLTLGDLKVKSFVTDINSQSNQVIGGRDMGTIICLTGNYPTLPVQGCTEDYTTRCFTNNTTGTTTN